MKIAKRDGGHFGWWVDNREAVDENGGFWMTGGAVGSEQLGKEER